MKISNTQYYHDVPFDDYLKIPGTSFSSLKGEIPQSAGMALGSRVHQYLNEPEKYDWVQPEIVKPIAAIIRNVLGEAFQYMDKEVAFTCDFEHNGMKLTYKGRADALKVGRIVVDFKVLAGSLESACARFGYVDQIAGYCTPTHCALGVIIAYNKTTKKVEIKTVSDYAIQHSLNSFWAYQVVRLGGPVE